MLGESGGTLPAADADETFRQIVELFVGALEGGAWPAPPEPATGGTAPRRRRPARTTDEERS